VQTSYGFEEGLFLTCMIDPKLKEKRPSMTCAATSRRSRNCSTATAGRARKTA
jgi:hypothetical protein